MDLYNGNDDHGSIQGQLYRFNNTSREYKYNQNPHIVERSGVSARILNAAIISKAHSVL
jgi:hypothetical protein